MPAEHLENLTIDKLRQKPLQARRRSTTYLIMALVLVAAAIGAFMLVRSRPIAVETVSVSLVYPTQAFTRLNASGYVVAQRKAAVAAKTTGRLEWLGVEEGSRVTGGQVIARLENRDAEAAVRQGEANLTTAKAALEQAAAELTDARQSFQRQKDLLGQGIVSRSEYDAAEARYLRAKAAVNGARAGVRSSEAALQGLKVAFDYSLIRAPFDAVVLTKNADIGDIITPLGAAANAKAAVVTIADLGSLQVEVDVSEANLGMVKAGQPCEITLDALPDRRFRGVVHTIVPTADRSKASVMVKVRFTDKDARTLPEMSAKVAFLEREPAADERTARTAVNAAAIMQMDGQDVVYLVKGDRVVRTPVRRLQKLGDNVELAGVKPGDKLVIKPLDRLRDGMKIQLGEK